MAVEKEKMTQAEKMENKSKGKNKPKKKTVIGYSIAGVAIIAVGVVGGVLIGRNVFKQNAYEGLDINNAETDYDGVYQTYKQTNKDRYFEIFFCNIVKSYFFTE